jgi:hypothetical protein
MKWMRMRFKANADDYRCINWPPPGPYWCSVSGLTYSVVVAFIPIEDSTPEEKREEKAQKVVLEGWPEAVEIETCGKQWDDKPTFSDRFACPKWWDAENNRFCGVEYKCLCTCGGEMDLEPRVKQQPTLEFARKLAVAEIGPTPRVKTRRKRQIAIRRYKRKLLLKTQMRFMSLGMIKAMAGMHYVCSKCGKRKDPTLR